jgi:hypothetical protein
MRFRKWFPYKVYPLVAPVFLVCGFGIYTSYKHFVINPGVWVFGKVDPHQRENRRLVTQTNNKTGILKRIKPYDDEMGGKKVTDNCF